MNVPARVVCDVPGLAYVQQLLSAHGQVMHPDTHLLVDVSMFDGKRFTEKPLKLFISEEQPTMWRCGEYSSNSSTPAPSTPLFALTPAIRRPLAPSWGGVQGTVRLHGQDFMNKVWPS